MVKYSNRWPRLRATILRPGFGCPSGNVHDHCFADDFLDDVEIHFAFVMEGHYV
jgi:hypothetical protein